MPFWRRRPKEEKKEVRDAPGPELANWFAEIRQLLDDHERRIRIIESKFGISPVEPVGKREVKGLSFERKETTKAGKPAIARKG